MKLFRFFLSSYRFFLSKIFKLSRSNTMSAGVNCHISEFKPSIYHGDIVHPCVRFSEQKFKGYNWWLIYTPYYNSNSDVENPILCYGISDDGGPPTYWHVYKEIIGKPLYGYNSDPTMFFDSKGLNIFWRENATPRTEKDHLYRATYGFVLSEHGEKNLVKPILCEKEVFMDKEVSPTILKLENSYFAYAMHIRFKNSRLHSDFSFLEKLIQISLKTLSVLEVYNEKKTFGISIWKSDDIEKSFKYIKTTKIINRNKLYIPWHLDVFRHKNKLYAIIQTTQTNADICLAVCDDDENFTMYSKPLITNFSIGKLGIYKPTGFVHKDVFYLYYTAQEKSNRLLNKMFLTKEPFDILIDNLS